jgi:hypothetical protein
LRADWQNHENVKCHPHDPERGNEMQKSIRYTHQCNGEAKNNLPIFADLLVPVRNGAVSAGAPEPIISPS